MRLALTALILVMINLVTVPSNALTPGELAIVDTLNLNVRNGPSTDSEVVTTLPQGTVVLIEKNQDGWTKVTSRSSSGAVNGWVSSRFLRGRPSNSPSPSPVKPSKLPASKIVPPQPTYSDPLSITSADFDCIESYSGGFSDCELEINISISIPRVYSEYLTDSVMIGCDAEIAYRTTGNYFEQTEREHGFTYVQILPGYSFGTVDLDFDFGYTFEPVVNARVKDLSCRPGY